MEITITKQQLEPCDLTHCHAGNGFVMVEDVDKEYCRVATYNGNKLDWLVRLAAKDRLSVSLRRAWVEEAKSYAAIADPGLLPPELMYKLTEIRTGIRSGKLKVEKNRVVECV